MITPKDFKTVTLPIYYEYIQKYIGEEKWLKKLKADIMDQRISIWNRLGCADRRFCNQGNYGYLDYYPLNQNIEIHYM